jgi:hypothetical protein
MGCGVSGAYAPGPDEEEEEEEEDCNLAKIQCIQLRIKKLQMHLIDVQVMCM